jgi:hypothetical protein
MQHNGDNVPLPVEQTQVGVVNPVYPAVQPQYAVMPKPAQNRAPAAILIGVAVAGGVALIVILAGVLYVWANSLASSEIEGDWHNPAQTFTFHGNGDIDDSTNTWSEWRVDGNTLYMVDPNDPDYEYYFRFDVKGDNDEILFLAPIDYDGSVAGEDCSAYTRDPRGATDDDVFERQVENVIWPSWCTPE